MVPLAIIRGLAAGGSFLLLALTGAASLAKEYPAPDGAMTAVATEKGSGNCEARIVWQTADRGVVFARTYVSHDGEHGYCLRMAGWTPDSQFFVFSLYSSGGHQPWHVPLLFFSRPAMQLRWLDDYLPDPVTGESFALLAPDIIEVETTRLPLDGQQPVRRRLSLGQLPLVDKPPR